MWDQYYIGMVSLGQMSGIFGTDVCNHVLQHQYASLYSYNELIPHHTVVKGPMTCWEGNKIDCNLNVLEIKLLANSLGSQH